MGIILIVILVIVLIGALPTWRHSKSWEPYPSGISYLTKDAFDCQIFFE